MVKILAPYKIKTPEYEPGMAISIMPSGHRLWLEDYFYYDQLGRDPMQLRKIWLIEDSKARLEAFKEIVEEYPTEKHRRNMLYTVIDRNDEDCVRHLLDTGLLVHPDIEQAKTDQEAYEEARSKPDFEEPDSAPDIPDPSCIPVHLAAFQGKLKLLELLYNGGRVEVDCLDEFGRTPLHAAAGGSSVEVVRYLLGQGADPTIRTYSDENTKRLLGEYAGADPLELAIGQGNGNFDIVKMLLEHPFHGSTRKRKWTGDVETGVWVTPLAIRAATQSGNGKTLKFLLERGGYPTEDADGRTKGELLNEKERELITDLVPIALEYADFESLNLLLSYIYPTDKDGSVLQFPVSDEHRKAHTYGTYGAAGNDDVEKFRFMHSFGLTEHDTMSLDPLPNAQTVNIQAIFERTATYGAVHCAKILVKEFGADPQKHRFPPGFKPLYIAAGNDKTDYLRWLVEDQKVDLHAGSGRYITGPTALWIAISLRSISCVEVLLQNGGPLDHIDEELKQLEAPVTAILSARRDKAARTTVRLELEDNAQEFVDKARNDFMSPMSNYLRLELGPDDKSFIDHLVLRHSREHLHKDETLGKHGYPREVGTDESQEDDKLSKDDPKILSPPIPTYKAREGLVRKDDDLYPEFQPFLVPA